MISYKPLWKTLVEREMKKTDLLDVVGISRGTLTKLSKNEPVSVKIIDRICEKLEIEVHQIIKIKYILFYQLFKIIYLLKSKLRIMKN